MSATTISHGSSDGTTAGWQTALGDFEEKRHAFDQCAPDDPMCSDLLDAYFEAQDVLVEDVRAPNLEAVILKIELAKERWDLSPISPKWLDAFAADLRGFMPTPTIPVLSEHDPLRGTASAAESKA